MKALARALGVEGRVRFAGFRADVPDVMACFDLFVRSSREEGLCTSIIDAMELGVPVVGTRAGGIPELVLEGETGLAAPVADPAGLADAVLRALADPAAARARAERARAHVRAHFTADAMVDGTLAVYREFLERGG
jgi:glycosyltransferase involved in cell wall biosynthesis